MCNITDLPLYVLVEILSYLSIEDLTVLQRVSYIFSDVVKSHSLWKFIDLSDRTSKGTFDYAHFVRHLDFHGDLEFECGYDSYEYFDRHLKLFNR